MQEMIKMALLLILFSSKLLSCADSWSEMYVKDEYYNFLNPSMVHLNPNNPLYQLSNTPASHEARFKYFKNIKKMENIKAWYVYFNKNFSKKKITSIFYKKNSISKNAKIYQDNKQYPAFSRYLIFLDQQNQYAQPQEESNETNFLELIESAKVLLSKETDPFLKERYLYLLMRLYHHHYQYKETLKQYEDYQFIINKNSIVKEWIDALCAGAYLHLNQPIKANQLYAKIFKNHKSNAHLGYYDFKINSDESWKNLLKSTDNNETKALYHFLRAMNWKNEPLFELDSIASLAIDSIWFERLAYMIMQKLQHQRYKLMAYNQKDKYFKSEEQNYYKQKKRFTLLLSKVKNPTFFTLYSKMYLETLDQKIPRGKNLKKLLTLAKNNQRHYVQLLSYMNTVHQLSSNSVEEQKLLNQHLELLLDSFNEREQVSILRYTALHLAKLYPPDSIENYLSTLFANNQTIKRYEVLSYLNFEKPIKVQTYIEKQQRSLLEKQVFTANMHVLKKNDVAKILSTLYMQENNFTKAKFYLRQIPRENLYSKYNPFNTSVNGNNRTVSKTSYTQMSFAQTMLRLEEKLKKNPHSSMDNFLYANGLYNKSWFGNFPMSSVLHRQTIFYKNEKIKKTMSLNKAETFYLHALNYVEHDIKKEKDQENFKAKISYQLLKIKFHRAMINVKKYEKNIWTMPIMGSPYEGTKKTINLLKKSINFSEAIRDFKDDYAQTNYGREVIKNCITFQYF